MLESGNTARLALNVLNQSWDKLKFWATVRAVKLRLIMSRGIEVLIKPIKGLEGTMAEIALIAIPIERVLICKPINQLRLLRETLNVVEDWNLRDNTELVSSSCDLMAIDMVTTWLDVHYNRWRSLKHVITKRAFVTLFLVGRRGIVLVQRHEFLLTRVPVMYIHTWARAYSLVKSHEQTKHQLWAEL